ncbi:reverse transcriptase domain-containing protein, partial [Enterobacter cloacae complex sp. 2DZ2F20B]|uniref:reverse transcriptase domain-containing protein n=1 Tax=Enterobacter cloacae complex sp. 2DZ2F20B TaxID=2511993 RepID=UPI0010269772
PIYSKRVVPSDENSIVNNTRSKTKKRIEEKDEMTEVQFAALLTEGEKIVTKTPETLAEALATNDSKQWELAMADELESLAKNEVWELVELPANRRPIQNKWIFKIKTNPDGSINKYKARLVIKGCSQKAGIDYAETFSPVARFESVRVLLAIAAAKNYELFQIDVKTAFL